jgi:hypothetical protein
VVSASLDQSLFLALPALERVQLAADATGS